MTVTAQILPVGARKGDEQVGRTNFYTNVKLQGLEERWLRGFTKITYLFFSVSDIFVCESTPISSNVR